MEMPDMKNERQNHSMVNIGDKTFIIGGTGIKKVDVLSFQFETWDEYPDMNYDRRDPSVCVVNNQFLYVFMGYSQTLGDYASNFERLDISEEPYCSEWKLLPLTNPLGIKIKSHAGVIPYETGFLFLGGFYNSQCDRNVFFLDLKDNNLKFNKLSIPFSTAFGEKSMVQKSEIEYFLFSYGNLKLMKFDAEKLAFYEVIL
jgi:hypothetical protein